MISAEDTLKKKSELWFYHSFTTDSFSFNDIHLTSAMYVGINKKREGLILLGASVYVIYSCQKM